MDERRLVEIEGEHIREQVRDKDWSVCRSCQETWPCTVMQLHGELQKVRGALAYYAEPEMWQRGAGIREGQPVDLEPPVLRLDEGALARQVLGVSDG